MAPVAAALAVRRCWLQCLVLALARSIPAPCASNREARARVLVRGHIVVRTREYQVHELEERVERDDGADHQHHHAPLGRQERVDTALDQLAERHRASISGQSPTPPNATISMQISINPRDRF